MSSTISSPGQNRGKTGRNEAKRYRPSGLVKPESDDSKRMGIKHRPAPSPALDIKSAEAPRRLAIQESERTPDSTLTTKHLTPGNQKRTANPLNEQNPAPIEFRKRKRGGKRSARLYRRWVEGLAADDPRRVKIRKLQLEEKDRIKKEIEDKNKHIMEWESVDVDIKGKLDNSASNSFKNQSADNDPSEVTIQESERNPVPTPALKNQSAMIDLTKLAVMEGNPASTLMAQNLATDTGKSTTSPQNEQNPAPIEFRKRRRGGKKSARLYSRWVEGLAADDPRRIKIEGNEQIRKLQLEKERIRKEIVDRDRWIMESETVDVQMKGELDNLVRNSFLRTIVIQQDAQSLSSTSALRNQSADDPRRPSIQEEEERREVAHEMCRIEKEVKGKQDCIQLCEVLDVDTEENMDNAIWDM